MEIHIADNGPGMNADIKRKIFIPFFSTKPNGDGIGLAMVERIIAHNAEIQVRSAPKEGATLFVYPSGMQGLVSIPKQSNGRRSIK